MNLVSNAVDLDTISWWVWAAWIDRDQARELLYGCAARAFVAPAWPDTNRQQFPCASGKIVVAQCTVTAGSFNIFRTVLEAGQVKLDSFFGAEAPEPKIKDTRVVIQGALGQSAARSLLYYTLPDLRALFGASDELLERCLHFLTDQLGFPFTDSYVGRLGNFEIFDLHAWLDLPTPFLIEAIPPAGTPSLKRETLAICRTPEFAANQHLAHVRGRIHADVVVDRIVILAPGQLRGLIEVPDRLDQLDFWLFDATGETVLHSESSTYMNQIGFNLAPVSRQVTLQDDLTQRAGSNSKPLKAQVATVVGYTSQRSMIGAPLPGSWRKFSEGMDDFVASRLPKSSEDRWFPQGIEGEAGAIAHLNHLLNGGSVSSAVLVDPWFNADALRRFVLRIGGQDVRLTIVTSWREIDPITGISPDGGQPIPDLETTLAKIRPYLNPHLKIMSVVEGRAKAFHDRYLLLNLHDGAAPRVFLLSNSLNNAAGDWPFAMSLLAQDVTREVRRYIEGLTQGRDTARGKALTINFMWPADAT